MTPLVCLKCGRTFTRKRGNLKSQGSVYNWLGATLARHMRACRERKPPFDKKTILKTSALGRRAFAALGVTP